MNSSNSASGAAETSAAGMWTYPHGLGRTVVADLVGYQVVATDGEVGHVDLATDDNDSAAIVVDTGHWIFGKKRMIPAGVIDTIDAQEQTVSVKMSKDDIKHAPDYVDHVSQDLPDLHRDEMVKYYRRWWG